MADTDFITRHDAQVEYCKLCGMCKTPGKKENVENACIQSFPAKNPILEIPAADVRPAAEISDAVDETIDFLNSVYSQMPYHVYSALFDLICGICHNCSADMRETGR